MLHKKLILSLAVVIALFAVGSMATFGGFVGSTNATRDFSAGKVVPTMSVTDTNGNPFSIANLVPEDKATGYINIHNAGPTKIKCVSVKVTAADPSSPLDHAIWVTSQKLGIDNWGLGGVEQAGWWPYAAPHQYCAEPIATGGNIAIPITFWMHPTDNYGTVLGEIDNTDPLQGAHQTLTFTVKAYQRDGTVRTYSDSVDL